MEKLTLGILVIAPVKMQATIQEKVLPRRQPAFETHLCLSFSYERDKYVQFFMAAITAMGAVIGFATKGHYWWRVGILAGLTPILSYFVFMKVLFQCAVSDPFADKRILWQGLT